MARPIPDMDQMTAAEVATDDSIIIDDTSASETKRINVGDLLGLPNFGWTSTGEVHTFSSFNTTTRLGVITVPSNATTKYSPGMWYRISQATGGTKWGIITAVTTTTITVNFFYNQTLNNETITTPFYSPHAQPQGAPLLPIKNTDANGWKIWDFGTRKEWTKYFTRAYSQAGNTWTHAVQEALPVNMASTGTNIVSTSVQSGDAAVTANIGSSPGATGIQVQHTNQYGLTVTSTLYIYARIMEA